MIDLESLTCLDCLLWLRTGEEVGRRLDRSQSTISRNARRAQQVFGLELSKREGEWDLHQNDPLLLAERRVHQVARWQGRGALRLEATYWSGPLLATPVPRGWMLGLSNIVGISRNLDLLRQRIVDVWIAGLPDLPAADDPELTAIQLSSMPVHCVVREGHPLLRQRQLSFQDLAAYPSLALPAGAYPLVEEALERIGLWSTPVRMQRYDRRLWEGRSEEELTIAYGTALSLEVAGAGMRRLPLQLPFQSGDALVVRREFAAAPALLSLRTTLLERLKQLAVRHPEIRLTAS